MQNGICEESCKNEMTTRTFYNSTNNGFLKSKVVYNIYMQLWYYFDFPRFNEYLYTLPWFSSAMGRKNI